MKEGLTKQKGGNMLKRFIVPFLFMIPFSVFAQTQEDIEYALNEVAKPLGGVVNDAVLEDANTLGGLPHFQLTGGINLRTVSFRDPENPDSTNQWTAGAISLEGRIGLFKGNRIAPTIGGFGSADLLLRMAFYPVGNGDSVSFVPLFGMGLKIGILRESLSTPAVSITGQFTSSREFELSDTSGTYAAFTMNVFSLRADVSKNFIIVSPYAGFGFNINSLKADIWYKDQWGVRNSGHYDVSPSASRLYVGLHKQIFLLGLNLEGGLSGDTFYWAFGLSGGI